jgi:hypothetical protein
MYLNVFIDVVIEFHHLFLIVTFLPCIPTYTFFFHSIQWLPSQHAIPVRSLFSILIDPFQLSYTLSLLFTFIHHPTFCVITGCAEHSGAQVYNRSTSLQLYWLGAINIFNLNLHYGWVTSSIGWQPIFYYLLVPITLFPIFLKTSNQ